LLETELYSALAADTTITGVTSMRIYPVIMPQDVTFPAITYECISGQPVNGLDGYLGMDNSRMMLNMWATRYDEAKELAEDVHDCLNKIRTFRALLVNHIDGYDVETGLYIVSQDYSCWNAQ
jgi:hypothetical protein